MIASSLPRAAALAAALALVQACTDPGPPPPPAGGVSAFVAAPQVTSGLVASPGPGDHALVELDGPGVFVSAQVTRQGGGAGLSFVDLEIDGRTVFNASFAALQNVGLTGDNPYGVARFDGAGTLDTVAIGFGTPLIYEDSLQLGVTVQQPGVDQILANVVHGR